MKPKDIYSEKLQISLWSAVHNARFDAGMMIVEVQLEYPMTAAERALMARKPPDNTELAVDHIVAFNRLAAPRVLAELKAAHDAKIVTGRIHVGGIWRSLAFSVSALHPEYFPGAQTAYYPVRADEWIEHAQLMGRHHNPFEVSPSDRDQVPSGRQDRPDH